MPTGENETPDAVRAAEVVTGRDEELDYLVVDLFAVHVCPSVRGSEAGGLISGEGIATSLRVGGGERLFVFGMALPSASVGWARAVRQDRCGVPAFVVLVAGAEAGEGEECGGAVAVSGGG